MKVLSDILSDRRVVKFTVNCPLYPFSKQTMWMEFVRQESGWLPLPCNGCDMMGGDPTCEKCRAALTLMFYKSPDLDVSNPISPQMSLVEDR